MENDRRTVKEIVKKMRGSGGEEIAVVRCDDGSYGVTHAGNLIETLRWDPGHLAECIEFVERFSRTS
jgi:hypothetical protein